jgi:hypothetical protein
MLGPLEVRTGGDPGETVEVAGARLRALLVMLALRPGQLVTSSQLIDGLWPDEMPAAAVVLPAPFGPSRPKTEPVGTARSMPARAAVPPNRLASPSVMIEYVMPLPCRPALTARPDRADAAARPLTSR